MANEQLFGVRGFQATTLDELTSLITTFLRGDGTVEDPAKELTQPLALILDGGIFYTLLTFRKKGE